MVSDGEHRRLEIAREGVRVAVAEIERWSETATVSIASDRSFGLLVGEVETAIEAAVDTARAWGMPSVVLMASDPLVRDVARAAGFSGALRTPLIGTIGTAGVVAPSVQRNGDAAELVPSLESLLPGTSVVIETGGWAARLSRRLVTGMAGNVRVIAQRAGVRVASVVPVGPDLMVESLAAAIDTQLAVESRLRHLAGRLPAVFFAMASAQMMHGRVSGQVASGGLSVNPAHVHRSVYGRLAIRPVIPRPERGMGSRPSRGPIGDFLPVDGVVAHELGHCVDQLGSRGSLSDTTEFRQCMGRAVGVGSIEKALRGREADAPADWRRAHDALRDQISDYATTSVVELFAEVFSVSAQSGEGSLVAAFDGFVAERFPS